MRQLVLWGLIACGLSACGRIVAVDSAGKTYVDFWNRTAEFNYSVSGGFPPPTGPAPATDLSVKIDYLAESFQFQVNQGSASNCHVLVRSGEKYDLLLRNLALLHPVLTSYGLIDAGIAQLQLKYTDGSREVWKLEGSDGAPGERVLGGSGPLQIQLNDLVNESCSEAVAPVQTSSVSQN
jgi:hypothetical protein